MIYALVLGFSLTRSFFTGVYLILSIFIRNLTTHESEGSDKEWVGIYRELSDMQVRLLSTLGPRFLSDALDWMGVHQERILFIINNCVKEPLSIHTLNETETVLSFLIQISDYKDAWIREIGQVSTCIDFNVARAYHELYTRIYPDV